MPILFLWAWGFSEICFPQVGMNGDAFSIKAPKECSKKFAAILKGNLLPEEMFLGYFLSF